MRATIVDQKVDRKDIETGPYLQCSSKRPQPEPDKTKMDDAVNNERSRSGQLVFGSLVLGKKVGVDNNIPTDVGGKEK